MGIIAPQVRFRSSVFYHLQEKSLRRTTEGLHGLCSQVIRTVFSGRNTDLAFENTGKIALIFESDRQTVLHTDRGGIVRAMKKHLIVFIYHRARRRRRSV